MPRPPANNNRSWMTTREVADTFEVTVATVRDWISAGKLSAYKVNGYNRVDRQEVARFARERYRMEDDPETPPV